MYRDAADEDYLIARFSARTNLVYQFWWSAQQAVEKYLKAALLLNGHPVSQYGHQLSGMLQVARSFSEDLLPHLHCPPRNVVTSAWPNTNPRSFMLVDDFVGRVENLGNPNSRYRATSNYTRASDLIHFDELCFLLRRICFPLDLQVTGLRVTGLELLRNDRTLHIQPKMSFEGSMTKRTDGILREHFTWCNFAYFYDEVVRQGEYPSWGGGMNAEPFLAIQSNDPDYKDALIWIAENAFPGQLKRNIVDAVTSAMAPQ
jgi:HEPN domain-containing protein